MQTGRNGLCEQHRRSHNGIYLLHSRYNTRTYCTLREGNLRKFHKMNKIYNLYTFRQLRTKRVKLKNDKRGAVLRKFERILREWIRKCQKLQLATKTEQIRKTHMASPAFQKRLILTIPMVGRASIAHAMKITLGIAPVMRIKISTT